MQTPGKALQLVSGEERSYLATALGLQLLVLSVVLRRGRERGGKIVIQAKRYTNTVGVSAVRDLYGTLMNEGATKGILVTTSDFGPDAYDFAKGKPLTLLNGANLHHLLEKHGHKACIDIRAAKLILSEQGD